MPASHIILVFRELLSMLSLPDVYLLVYVIIRNCIIQSIVHTIVCNKEQTKENNTHNSGVSTDFRKVLARYNWNLKRFQHFILNYELGSRQSR
jgi:hypothetical protein